MQNIAGVQEASGKVETSAMMVLNVADEINQQSQRLKKETQTSLRDIRAA